MARRYVDGRRFKVPPCLDREVKSDSFWGKIRITCLNGRGSKMETEAGREHEASEIPRAVRRSVAQKEGGVYQAGQVDVNGVTVTEMGVEV